MSKKTVMVVDDELPVCKSVASALPSDEYDVSTALSADEALSNLSEHVFDVVITDLMMPGMSGMELLEKVHDKYPDTTVIMITGYPSVRSAVQAVKLGAFDYLPKPFTPNELRSLISRALASRTIKEQEHEENIQVEIPDGLYCIPENSWVQVDPEGQARVGVHHLVLNTIERIASIELPKVNDMRYQGEACAIINDINGHVVRLWTPVSGRIIEVNEDIHKDYSLVMDHPYHDGWLLTIIPTHLEDELKNLVRFSKES